jgi:hypothetical protein
MGKRSATHHKPSIEKIATHQTPAPPPQPALPRPFPHDKLAQARHGTTQTGPVGSAFLISLHILRRKDLGQPRPSIVVHVALGNGRVAGAGEGQAEDYDRGDGD